MDLIAATAPHTCTRKTSLAGVAVYGGFLSILSFFLSFFLHLFLHLMYPRIKSLDIYTNTVRNTAYHTNRNFTADDVTSDPFLKKYIYLQLSMLLTLLALSVVASPSAGGFTVWNECPCSNETLCQPIQTPRTQEDVYAFHTNSPSNVFGKNNQSWRVSNTHSLQLGYNARSRMTLRCQCRARTLKSQATATKTTCANKIGTCIYLPLPLPPSFPK